MRLERESDLRSISRPVNYIYTYTVPIGIINRAFGE